MNGFIFGFQRLVWWPKWTPASSSSCINSVDMDNKRFFRKRARKVPDLSLFGKREFWEFLREDGRTAPTGFPGGQLPVPPPEHPKTCLRAGARLSRPVPAPPS